MLELTRTVRFSVNPPSKDGSGSCPLNTFSAFPSMTGIGRHFELDIRCRGDADPVTGYFINIKDIDQAARAAVIPVIAAACLQTPEADPADIIRARMAALDAALGGGRLWSVRWRLSPYYSVEVQMTALHTAVLRQQFEFAAAHRLHVASMTDEENRALFGKCNNPSGHGHNYRVEPAVEVPAGDGSSPVAFTLADLERLTHDTIIRRFDHMHLNIDTEEFSDGGGNGGGERGGGDQERKRGLNPSVENIAKVCFDLLAPEVKRAGAGVRLRSITVWETDKTSCTYPA